MTPLISAVICTRNRGDQVAAAVESVLASDHPAFELIVVDQSDDGSSEAALAPFRADRRLRYLRSPLVGVARGRNLGLRMARAPLVAFTDDDCTAPPDWLRVIAESFAAHPRAAVVFTNVAAAPHEPALGFVPDYRCDVPRLAERVVEKIAMRGIGASMALRRGPALELGGFDEGLGPGAAFPACEDGDLSLRALLAGWQVYETPATAVVHHGFRTWHEGRALTRRDWVGMGAAYAKPLKCGRLSALAVVAYEGLGVALGEPLADALRLRRPRGLMRFVYFWSGFARGMRAPVDRRRVLYRLAEGPAEARSAVSGS